MANTFFVEQKELFSILSSMQPICSKRTTLDTTSYILFQVGHRELILKSTDLEVSLQSTCLLRSSTLNESISFLVPGKRIFDLVKELDGEIECTLKNNQFFIKSGVVNVGLHIKDAQTFPPFPERIENLMQLEAPFLVELIDKVAFLIPPHNANPALNGLFLEIDNTGLKMTTTDGHCLAQVYTTKYILEGSHRWLLPRRAVFEIKKILENAPSTTLFLGTCGNQLVFSGETFNFFTKLLADQFPQYAAILEKTDFLPATLDRAHFLKTLRRSACLLSGQFLATQFGFDNDRLYVSMENKEVGSLNEELALDAFKAARLDIRFYAPYLLSGLQAFSDDKITAYLKNSTKPIIFQAEKDAYHITYLVMPISPTQHAQ
ncbi:MAG: DNA polymerase III subunit beta [Candidatus Dependentiae bacterium ADurb.Bin331]|nr:MAG: DNA polymerase III subunit beta [Candidatus Dependentiae bacterium ADurb.Bin331]